MTPNPPLSIESEDSVVIDFARFFDTTRPSSKLLTVACQKVGTASLG